MARRERASSNPDSMSSVKLFVASTGWPYKPRWNPQSPLVFLFGGAEDNPTYISPPSGVGGGHIGARCKDLVRKLLDTDAKKSDVFIVDLSQAAPPAEWREEAQKPGRASRMLSKWFLKFNPSKATLVVSGADAALALALIKSLSRPATASDDHFVERVIVAGRPPSKKIMDGLAAEVKVKLAKPSPSDVYAAVLGGQGMSSTSEAGADDLYFVSVDFSIDPVNKGLLQTPIDITAAVLCPAAPIKVPALGGPGEAQSYSPDGLALHHLEFGMSVTGVVAQAISIAEAGSMKHVVLADTHSSVEALVHSAAQVELQRGAMYSVEGRTMALEGRLLLLIHSAKQLDSLRLGYKTVRMGQRSISQRAHQCGCIVMRGSKCVLAHRDGFPRIPMVAPMACESKQQAATRAVKTLCKVYAEELALLHDVPPALVYDTSGPTPVVVTVFAAVATTPPPAED